MKQPDQQLSEHFHLREFLSSQTAERQGLDVIAPVEIIDSLMGLCTLLLEPIRVQLGLPIVISSGYRPDWLNRAVGGSKTSAHLFGRAADIKVIGMTPIEVCRWIADRPFPFDQLIHEGSWTHIAIGADIDTAPMPKPRREILTANFGPHGTTYTRGLA